MIENSFTIGVVEAGITLVDEIVIDQAEQLQMLYELDKKQGPH